MQKKANHFTTTIKNIMSGVEYQFSIERKFTIIQGNSGTGKTTLIGLLDLCTREYSVYAYTMESDCTFIAFPGRIVSQSNSSKQIVANLDRFIKEDREFSTKDPNKIVFYCDETEPYLGLEKFQEAISDSDYSFLIVTRGRLLNLPYGVEDIYKVVNIDDKKHILQRMYPDNCEFPQGDYVMLKTGDDSPAGFTNVFK